MRSKLSMQRMRRWMIGLLLTGLVLAVAVVWIRHDPLSHEARVRRAFRDRRFDDASHLVADWRKAAPRSVEPPFWEARIALARRSSGAFNDALKEAESLGLDRPRANLLKALSTALGGRFAEVELILRDAFNQGDPKQPDLLVLEALASGYVGMYDFPRASLVIGRWITESPNDPTPYLLRAEIDSRTNNNAALIVDYRQALKRDPASARARLGLAEALREAHQSDEAAIVIAEFLKSQIDDAAGHLCAGRIAIELGRLDEASAHFEKTVAIDPKNPVSRRAFGELLLRQGKLPEALSQLETAKTLDPFDLDIRHQLGSALVRVGKVDEAKKEQAVATRFRTELQTMLAAQSRLLKAPAHLESRLEICRWMFEHGKADQGCRWAETILKDNPGQPGACRLLADHYEQSGRPGLANFYRSQTAQPKH